MRASYAFVLQKNNAEVSTYSVLTPTFIIEPKDPLRCLSFVTMHAKTESLKREAPFIGINYWLFSTMQAVP